MQLYFIVTDADPFSCKSQKPATWFKICFPKQPTTSLWTVIGVKNQNVDKIKLKQNVKYGTCFVTISVGH